LEFSHLTHALKFSATLLLVCAQGIMFKNSYRRRHHPGDPAAARALASCAHPLTPDKVREIQTQLNARRGAIAA
jgi:hypothetical protein